MEVVERGVGWSVDATCTGLGNGGGGCQAKLKVHKEDLYITQSHHYDGSSDTYITFRCPECKIETDIENSKIPSAISRNLRGKKEWEALNLANNSGGDYESTLKANVHLLLAAVWASRHYANLVETELDSEALATDIIDCAENVVSHINNKEELKFAVAEVITLLKGD